MRISDWSSDVCSSDLHRSARGGQAPAAQRLLGRSCVPAQSHEIATCRRSGLRPRHPANHPDACIRANTTGIACTTKRVTKRRGRSPDLPLLADVQHQRVLLELVAMLLRDFLLQLFDLGALELDDPAGEIGRAHV